MSVACAAGASAQAVKLAGKEDIVYAPDQADFVFDQGLTIAAWIKPNNLNGTQSIARKRFAGTSSFTLAIDDQRLNFVVRLTSGKLVGVTARVQAQRFTHVAATYDGQKARLFVDGTLAAQASGAGKIAPGAGPILIGNDAGRAAIQGHRRRDLAEHAGGARRRGQGLTCIRQAPVASLSPAMSPATPPGTPVAFDLSINNPSGASCPADDFQFFGSLPFPLSSDQQFGIVSVAPGQTAHATVNVTAFDAGASGPIPFQYFVASSANFSLQTTAAATFVIAPPAPPSRTGCAVDADPAGRARRLLRQRQHRVHGRRAPHTFPRRRPAVARVDVDGRAHLAVGLSGDGDVEAERRAHRAEPGLLAAGSPYFDPSYIDTLDNAVAWAEMAGMDVILDLHWSDRGVLGGCNPANGCQQLMPDANSATFWSQVATHYKDDGRVMFELYNEPHDVDWRTWKSGGPTFEGWTAVGMQQLYDTVRATGAQNVVVIGGLDWAYDLSGVPANRIAGYNIVYATHPYTDTSGFSRPPSDWGRAFGS